MAQTVEETAHQEQLEAIAEDMIKSMEYSIDEYYYATACKDKITKSEIYAALTKMLIDGRD